MSIHELTLEELRLLDGGKRGRLTDTVMKRPLLAAVIRGMPVKATLENTCNRVAEVQDGITRKATLKAVGELLKGKTKNKYGNPEMFPSDIESFLRGEMPEKL